MLLMFMSEKKPNSFFDQNWIDLSYNIHNNSLSWKEDIPFIKQNKHFFSNKPYSFFDKDQIYTVWNIRIMLADQTYILTFDNRKWHLVNINGVPITRWLKMSDEILDDEIFLRLLIGTKVSNKVSGWTISDKYINEVNERLPQFFEKKSLNPAIMKLYLFLQGADNILNLYNIDHQEYIDFICNYIDHQDDFTYDDFLNLTIEQMKKW